MNRVQQERRAAREDAALAPQLLVRTGAALYAGACLVVLAWIFVARLPSGHRIALAALVAVGLAIAGGIALRAERIPPRAYAALAAVAALLISAGVALSHGLASPLALLYLWGAAWAIAFMHRRQVALVFVISLLGYAGGVVAAGEGLSRSRAAGWLVVAATVVTMTVFIGVLVRALRLRDAEGLRRERSFRAIFESSADALYITDDERRFVRVNEAACELFGRSRGELLGLRLDDTWTGQASLEETWAIFRARGEFRFERDLVDAAGRVRRVDVIAQADVEP
ncbi:MAG: PAS domain S-box protein, partial [Solirubrobacteraceae bacterium]